MSEEMKKKISESLKGIKQSRETINKRINSRKGYRHSKETIKKISESNKGLRRSEETRKNISESHKGMRQSEESRMKKSEALKGEKSYLWKGGLTDTNYTIRHGIEYRLWRESVYARDNWTCQRCKKKGGVLRAHHIKNFATFPRLRFAIDNGITFCRNCHREFHHIYGVKNNTIEQLNSFI